MDNRWSSIAFAYISRMFELKEEIKNINIVSDLSSYNLYNLTFHIINMLWHVAVNFLKDNCRKRSLFKSLELKLSCKFAFAPNSIN